MTNRSSIKQQISKPKDRKKNGKKKMAKIATKGKKRRA